LSNLSVYLPQDRLRALARGETLPERTFGSAMLADISGFTLLTEGLVTAHGARRGAEELTAHLNAVYDDLIAEVERFQGSVISFAGDGITCWFDQDEGGRAAACAMALQSAIQRYQTISIPAANDLSKPTRLALKLKIAVTSGPVRRFIVGDHTIQRMEALGGATVARLSIAERLAHQGEVLVDAVITAALWQETGLGGWRADKATSQHFAVLTRLKQPIQMTLKPAQLPEVPDESLRPWVLPAVYAREISGMGEFLTELRSVVALFLRFQGIDYDADARAGEKLDVFIRAVQNTVNRYGGTLLGLNIGDKGSYLYIVFGAPTAYEDDPLRAVQAALDLQCLRQELNFLQPMHIGISRGTMRVGTYGGKNRRAYTVLGDEANVAARLMEAAAPGQTLVSQRIQHLTGEKFTFEPVQPLKIRGKAEAVPAFATTQAQYQRAIRLQVSGVRLPMIDRKQELALATEKIALVLKGEGQVLNINGEAGIGKSRLVAEIIALARQNGFTGYGGACQSYGTNSPYMVWKPIWQAFFDLDPRLPASEQASLLESKLARRLPERLPALPLLAPLLNLSLEENDFTRSLSPKDRKGALEALLLDCLRIATRREPILLVLEDLHWMDTLSHDLLEAIARAASQWSLLIVMVSRPPELMRLQQPRVNTLPYYTKILLGELSGGESSELLQARLAQMFPSATTPLPPMITRQIIDHAEGNPFYLEETLNYLRDRGVDPSTDEFALPGSLHTLILSRIDQLTEKQKGILKAASVIGRLFRLSWLHGYYPALGSPQTLLSNLDELAQLGLTLLETAGPDPAYAFKHLVTQEATYESLSYATRARLHEQLAAYLESLSTPPSAELLDLLAYHYSRSDNRKKAIEYLRKAGEAAQTTYANASAIEYYQRLLALLEEDGDEPSQDSVNTRLRLGAVLQLVGQWEEAERLYQRALDQASEAQCSPAVAECQKALGVLARLRGDRDAALMWMDRARLCWEALGDDSGISQVQMELGASLCQKGEFAAAQQALEESLALQRAMGEAANKENIAFALNWLGNVALDQSNHAEAQARYAESLALRREIGNRLLISASLNNLGELARHLDDFDAARALYEESLRLKRDIGDKGGTAILINNLAGISLEQDHFLEAHVWLEESLALSQEIGDKGGIAGAQFGLGLVATAQGDVQTAYQFHIASLTMAQALSLRQTMACVLVGVADLILQDQPGGSPATPTHAKYAAQMAGAVHAILTAEGLWVEPFVHRRQERIEAVARNILGEATFELAWQAGQQMGLEQAATYTLDKSSLFL